MEWSYHWSFYVATQARHKLISAKRLINTTMAIIVSKLVCFWFGWEYFRSCLDFNTLRPRQNGRHFPDHIFKWIFLNENVRISIKISMKFVPMGPIYNISALVQIMAWHRSGDKALSEPTMFSLLTHICVTRPQWVKYITSFFQPIHPICSSLH